MLSIHEDQSIHSTAIADMVRRIWARDYSLWPEPSPGGGGDWMGWLNLPGSMRFGIGLPTSTQRDALANATSFNLLGMGGSSLTAEVLCSLFPDTDITLNVFDTVNPTQINEALGSLDLSSATFAVASKSGTTVEPLSLESVFRAAINNHSTANQFIALTDPDTPLAKRASDGEFAFHVATPQNVGGRFSALSAFGMVPAAICGMPTDEMTRGAIAMADSCRLENNSNPGIQLGLFLAQNALRGRDKVTLATSPSLQRFGLWLEQLLAESTGKNGRGLIPIAGEPILPKQSYRDDRQFICIELKGENVADNPAHDDHPTYRIELPDLPSIAAEFFRWEFATTVAASAIGVYPFDQPDVEAAKQLAREALDASTKPHTNSMTAGDATEKIISNCREGDYVAIVAYMPESDQLTNAVSHLRIAISNTTGTATTFGYGPRYLHSTGQLHKGGPNSVRLIVLTQKSETDIPVPGQPYTLGQLQISQALGDVQACFEKKRQAVMAQIDGDAIAEIEAVARTIA